MRHSSIRMFRKYKLGLTLHEMSELTGINITTLSQWERGEIEPSLKTIRKMAQKTGISFEELVQGFCAVKLAS